MPPWLDFLRTPMAAPETPALRRLRLAWQGLCLASALLVGLITPLRHVVGRLAPVSAGVTLLATAACTLLYLLRKHRADNAFEAREAGK